MCSRAAEAVGANPGVVFTRVYLFDGGRLRLAASCGPSVGGAGEGSPPTEWLLLDVMRSSRPVIVEVAGEGAPGFAVATRIAERGSRVAAGVLVVGIADVRPIDDSQLAFIDFLAGQIASALAGRRALSFAAGTAERERIERDLHDGAQQRLMAILVKIGLLRDRVGPDLAGGLDEIKDDMAAAIDDLRRLAHGTYPSILRERGVPDGLLSAVERTHPRVSVVDRGIGRFDATVEAAVYFVALEAVQNATKHAGADASIVVTLARDAAAVEFAVVDDGAGFDERLILDGHGLRNMRDRLAAFGGELDVRSSPGRGTSIRGVVPL